MKTYTEEQMYAFIDRMILIYEKHIEKSIDWEKVEQDCSEWEDEGSTRFSFLGTVFQIMPSGKYWTFWACGNMDQREMIKDTAFSKALENVAQKNGYWIESGEDDPCDIFICKSY